MSEISTSYPFLSYTDIFARHYLILSMTKMDPSSAQTLTSHEASR